MIRIPFIVGGDQGVPPRPSPISLVSPYTRQPELSGAPINRVEQACGSRCQLLCHRVGKALNDAEQRKKRGLHVTRPIILGKCLVYMASLSIIVLGRSRHHPRLCLPPQRIPSPPLPQTTPHSHQGVIDAAVLVLFFALSPVCHVSPPVVPHYTTLASVSLNKQEILPRCIGPCKESGFWSPIRLDE